MSELLGWFTEKVKPTIDRPRARNYANFVTSLYTLEDLLTNKAKMASFIEAFERMQEDPPQGFESKPGVVLLRRRFEWVHARGFLDISQAINGTRRPYTQDSLLAVSVYHIPSRTWHTGMFAESEDITVKSIDEDSFPFPSQSFHSFSFEKKPDFDLFAEQHPDTIQTLRQLSVERRGRTVEDKVLGQCFVRRIVRGPKMHTNIAFPHL